MKRLPFLLMLALGPLAAHADTPPSESVRRFLVELKLSPYTPQVDSVFTNATPYRTFFGSGPMLLGEAELDVELWQALGTLSVGISGGYAEKYAKAYVDGTQNSATPQRSSESAGLHVVPIKLQAVYRFDYLWSAFDVPFVPYVKAGPMVIPWWTTKGVGTETDAVFRGAGYKFGLTGTLGVSFVLDVLDRRLARDFDTGTGVNHTALFAEFSLDSTMVFEKPNTTPLNLGSQRFNFGVSFEF